MLQWNYLLTETLLIDSRREVSTFKLAVFAVVFSRLTWTTIPLKDEKRINRLHV